MHDSDLAPGRLPDVIWIGEFRGRLAAVRGVAHLTRADTGDGFGRAPVTADAQPDAADAALASIDDLDIQAEDVSLSL
jgi:hypothetical protein